jgi:hypothetical protein
MNAIFDHPLFRLFFDLTANEGWNITAIAIYTGLAALIILSIIENRKGN